MGLIRLNRCKGSSIKLRLRNSFWTSAGAVVALFALTLVTKPGVHPGADWVDLFFTGSAREVVRDLPSERQVRRLADDPDATTAAPGCEESSSDSLYPDDWFISKPYQEDPLRYVKIFIHIILIGYMLLGLNTVCDVYFTGAIEELVTEFKITPDVAGATFMAAGGSAPELFTSLIGATLAMNDVGFGTIVGSAVFNVLFVIGLCGYAAQSEIKLTWWPLFRDCSYYIFSLAILAICAADKAINLIEAIILFLLYVVYCLIMYKNEFLNNYADSSLRKYKVAPETQEGASSNGLSAEKAMASNPNSYGKMTDVPDEKDNDPDPESTPEKTPEVPDSERRPERNGESTEEGRNEGTNALEENLEKDEDNDSDEGNYWDKPEGTFATLIWAASLPVYMPLMISFAYVHFPADKAEERFKNLFMCVFFQSLIWIAAFAYFLVWWVTVVFVEVLQFSVTVMGFTLLAAGTSIPDAVSSVVVARQGEGDMAVSSSIGSNIFDILVGLPIPWMIKIGIIEMGIKGNSDFTVNIYSDYIAFYVILLLCMVVCVILSIHFLGWKLNKALGAMMAMLYLIFLAVVLFVELVYDKLIKQKDC